MIIYHKPSLIHLVPHKVKPCFSVPSGEDPKLADGARELALKLARRAFELAPWAAKRWWFEQPKKGELVGGLVAINLIFPLIWGISSSQLTTSYWGVAQPPTRWTICEMVKLSHPKKAEPSVRWWFGHRIQTKWWLMMILACQKRVIESSNNQNIGCSSWLKKQCSVFHRLGCPQFFWSGWIRHTFLLDGSIHWSSWQIPDIQIIQIQLVPWLFQTDKYVTTITDHFLYCYLHTWAQLVRWVHVLCDDWQIAFQVRGGTWDR